MSSVRDSKGHGEGVSHTLRFCSLIQAPWRTQWELQAQELHYSKAAVQPGLNELLGGNRKSIK